MLVVPFYICIPNLLSVMNLSSSKPCSRNFSLVSCCTVRSLTHAWHELCIHCQADVIQEQHKRLALVATCLAAYAAGLRQHVRGVIRHVEAAALLGVLMGSREEAASAHARAAAGRRGQRAGAGGAQGAVGRDQQTRRHVRAAQARGDVQREQARVGEQPLVRPRRQLSA